ncbi:MAG: NAD(P)-binding domain-containing protein [Deinococcus-Thermus bacterium]|nr:NAD(P)-binding domain-containing protein [Deinococcota bacterium]
MERLTVIGVSHRRGGADALADWHERYAHEGALEALGLPHAVVLATCNRWEAVVDLPEGVDADEARRRLAGDGGARGGPTGRTPYAYARDGALERLIRVAAGLDSLNPGEDQIMRQVRAAYVAARDAGRTDAVLSFAFERALRAAKRVRREVALAPVRTSLFSLARPELERTLPSGATVLVLGAGEIGELAARSLRDIGMRVIIANRTEARARALGEELGVEAASLDDVRAAPPRAEALVCATPVRHLVDAEALRRTGARVCVDLGVPRNVDPAAARTVGVRLMDVDALQEAGAERRAELAGKLADAERLVLEELDVAVDEWNEKQLGPSIRRLRERTYETLTGAVSEDEARKLVGRLVHDPIKGLRAIAREHGVDVARTYLDETGLTE